MSIFGLTPMPDHVQSREEREFGSATDVVALDLLDVDPEVWTHRHTELIRTAAQDPAVIRILVNAAIKKALCREAGADRAWLFKVRPWYGHAEHFHVQIGCPADSADCKPPAPPPPRDGCDNELDFWFKESTLHPPPTKPKPPLTLAGFATRMQADRQSAVIATGHVSGQYDACITDIVVVVLLDACTRDRQCPRNRTTRRRSVVRS